MPKQIFHNTSDLSALVDASTERPFIFVASDHAGYVLKKRLCAFLGAHGYEFKDMGTDSEEAVDYPRYAHRLAEAVSNSENSLGLLLCGTGNGMAITSNKHPNIRAALCWNESVVILAREHNHANVLCLPVRLLSHQTCEELLSVFLQTSCKGGRHQRRVRQISMFMDPTSSAS